ncbi:MAG: LapA family protein [Alphaproteobacteria bacterium]|nr:LapA family protein [Alphaproteobacteria bacterium]
MRLIRWSAGFVLAVLIAAFAVANRQTVPVTWSPLHEALPLPVYVLVLVSLAAGFICGGIIMWLSESPLRRERRAQKKQIKTLERRLEETAHDSAAKPASWQPAALLSFMGRK